jgi:methionine sulfoxide reductase catalytic subunit
LDHGGARLCYNIVKVGRMIIKKANHIRFSEVTPHKTYLNRRTFLVGAATAGAIAAASAPVARWLMPQPQQPVLAPGQGKKLPVASWSPFSARDELTPYSSVTLYNNYYEFGTSKDQPAQLAKNFRTTPWTVTVEGEVAKPQRLSVDDLIKLAPLEERIYRHRCVEAWSMVVPWIGFPLSNLIKRAEPTSKAKYVQFFTALDPRQMPWLRQGGLEWPYREGLRMDEAMHPLTLLCFGLYGEVLPKQNGAPLRTVIPWKYGFKGTKAIVRINFVVSQPETSWNTSWPEAYAFYSNVNPQVGHPRYSQATEQRLDGSYFGKKIRTQMFNGYADQVASLYNGMDLQKFY